MAKLRLLVPMDGTDFSRRIEPQVRKLFPPDRWELKLLHVSRVPVDPAAAYEPAAVGPDFRLYMYGYEMPGAGLHPVYSEERLEEYRGSLERDLQDEVNLFAGQGYEVSAAVHFGEPAQAIVSYAEDAGVDVVAMATHHRKGFERLIHGSVARRALNRLTVPALLLRVEDERERGEGDDRDRGEADEGPHAGAHTPDADAARVARDDQMVTPAETSPAVLGGLHGRGVLTIVWDADGSVVGSRGSWFPDRPDGDLSPLEQAERFGRTLLFEGRMVNAETAGHDDEQGEHVRREVKVTSVRRYRDYGDETRTLVSFELEGDLDSTDVPDQYSHKEFTSLGLEQMAELAGLELPAGMSPQEEAEFRDRAWQSYKVDIEHRDEWGTARQNTPLPHGE